MNELRRDVLRLPVCGMYQENPYPPMRLLWQTRKQLEFDPALPPDEYAQVGYGIPESSLPYSELTGYTRERRPGELKTLVLENNRLRATFTPGFGGKLWSLYDKAAGRELLYSNSVVQFGKLAIRNAWLSGGVEWNIGFPGHTPFTVSDVFAVKLEFEGRPVLRIFEWERITGTPYQVDFFFPDDDAEFLFCAVKITNPTPGWTSTYWWSNTGLHETPQTRIIVPVTEALTHHNGLALVRPVGHEGVDATYPNRVGHAIDYFYYLPRGTRPWEAAVNGDGSGLLVTATPTMRGRKLFLWGNSAGGRRWSNFLSGDDGAYIEIQAGLAKTQLECVPVAPQSEITWLESYGPIQVDPARAHHPDYQMAMEAVAENVARRLPDDAIAALDATARGIAALPSGAGELLHRGSGWAALEGLPGFPADSLGPLQQPWLDLRDGKLPEADAVALPSWQVSEDWYQRLMQAETGLPGARRNCWLQYQLALNDMLRHADSRALMRLNCVDFPLSARPFAERLRAWIHQRGDDLPQALAAWRRALDLAPGDERLLVEAQGVFLAQGQAAEFLDRLPAAEQSSGRLLQLRIRTLLTLGRIDEAEALLAVPFEIADMQEGESSLSMLWIELQTRKQARAEGVAWDREYLKNHYLDYSGLVPEWADFRMGSALPPELT